ncbi:phenylalanine--tRNA ligase subunit alpha [Candidatus Mycoplasma mahonii]|uniref:phenylalanine--tRNA ligase subunit alpha n=1 Tax=Candidatus Mycoplasma mahonii TaxID=3004105 RepID=UPI0026EA52DE|nr:phenylalanine--tRNA ligase subunit alpha [Candidatus Mycoplasma mahonii]WKX02195.1 phenylalanine--tRNA ligase subunit alpha [Candidatus Mycoplasma mahonii]
MKLDHIHTLEELKLEKNKFYGEGSELKILQNKIRSASIEERSQIGKAISILKIEAEELFAAKAQEIKMIVINNKTKNEWIDVTIPVNQKGTLHPMTLVSNRFKEWFIQNGYFETIGSEIETNEYNFERLNIPEHHPAREMQDSLYINNDLLLRTHNTGFTARELEENKNQSFSHFTIGKVYRNDEDDQTHSHQFMQADLVSVGYLSFPNLIWTLKSLMSYVFEDEIEIRLRPSYFPFTEPSVEVDIKYNEKWIEVLGAGMLHKKVFDAANYNNDMNGFAAGIGIERIAMIKYGINDIREFYKNDMRFLKQFQEIK